MPPFFVWVAFDCRNHGILIIIPLRLQKHVFKTPTETKHKSNIFLKQSLINTANALYAEHQVLDLDKKLMYCQHDTGTGPDHSEMTKWQGAPPFPGRSWAVGAHKASFPQLCPLPFPPCPGQFLPSRSRRPVFFAQILSGATRILSTPTPWALRSPLP